MYSDGGILCPLVTLGEVLSEATRSAVACDWILSATTLIFAGNGSPLRELSSIQSYLKLIILRCQCYLAFELKSKGSLERFVFLGGEITLRGWKLVA
jgi:hypothetical protein